MLKLILILLLGCTPVFADTIPYQSKEIVEVYARSDPILFKDLQLKHTYKVFDEIFILPDEFCGEAELYDLKFYIDMDTTLESAYDANCYRILYENSITDVTHTKIIPEPLTMPIIFAILFLRKKKKINHFKLILV